MTTSIAEMKMQIKQLEDDFFEAFAKQYTLFDSPDDLYDYAKNNKEQIKKIRTALLIVEGHSFPVQDGKTST